MSAKADSIQFDVATYMQAVGQRARVAARAMSRAETGAKNAAQAEQNAGALGWTLNAEDVAAIDRVALDGQRTLAQRVWQHG